MALLGAGIFNERLKLRASWDCHVESLCCEKGFEVEKIEVVAVH